MTKKVTSYITNVLAEKRSEFGGKAVCPFAKPELDSNKLMIASIGDRSLGQLIDEFYLSNYESALFIIKDDVPAEQTQKFQIFVNKVFLTKIYPQQWMVTYLIIIPFSIVGKVCQRLSLVEPFIF